MAGLAPVASCATLRANADALCRQAITEAAWVNYEIQAVVCETCRPDPSALNREPRIAVGRTIYRRLRRQLRYEHGHDLR